MSYVRRKFRPHPLTRVLSFSTIGHLFEAEDESQEWPDLHAATRQARRAYQSDGTMPDWAAFEALIGQVRAAQ